MKKILVSILISLIPLNLYADYIFTTQDNIIINKISSKIEKILNNSSYNQRIALFNKLNEIQNIGDSKSRIYNIILKIKEKNYLIDYKTISENHYNSYGININQIKNSWLTWHNKARINLSKNTYSYSDRLDNTSYEWSQKQLKDGIMYHKRDLGDEFYNYKKIEKWFQDRGVKCAVKNRTTTSESIGKFGYYCKDGDCNQELTDSLKQIFDIYMAEKGIGYPADAHYRAIVHSDLSKIGFGLAIRKTDEKDWYEYYVTTHYCTKFTN